MKRTITLLVLIFAVSFTYAQKIAYIHRDSVILSMPEMKDAQKTLNDFLAQAESEIQSMQQEYNQKVQDFNQSKDTLSEFIQKSKIDDIQALQKRIQDFQVNAQTEYKQKQDALLIPIQKKFDAAVEKVAKKMGYDVVQNISYETLYVNPKYIITDEVMKELGIKK